MAAEAVKPDGPSLTDQQRRAIAARDVSVALSAGAGCGKTFVLTERFLSHLDPGGPDPARLGQLVAITFTERAAREMRSRIREKCRNRLLECPEADERYWLELLRELDTARIGTIHSFCGSLLRSHAVEAGLDPRFRVLDQAQADTLLSELINDQLREKLAKQDKAALDLMVRYGLGTLGEMIAQLLACRQEIDWDYWETVTADDLTAKWQDYHRREALPRIVRSIVACDEAKTVLEIVRQNPSGHAVMQAHMAFLFYNLPNLAESADLPAMLSELRKATMIRGAGSKKDWPNEELYEKYRKAVTSLREKIDAFKDRISFDLEAARPAAEIGLELLSLARGAGQAYEAEKQKRNALDFNDLLIHAKNLLVGPQGNALRKRWAANLHLLLVDEFQDTDPLQVELVKALCDNDVARGKLFFVGDFKQSIYRFRGADPRVFHRLGEEIPHEGRLPLSLNFRSQPAILDCVNALFGEEFQDYEPLRAHKPQISPTPAVELLWAAEDDSTKTADSDATDPLSLAQAALLKNADDENDSDQKPAERRRRREADWIARRIRAMLDSGERIVWDQEASKTGNPATRPVQAGDVALLFRALTDVEYYEEALRRYGIDYYLVGGHAFYAQQEVFDLLNLLKALESPCDQLSLLGVLRSPFFNLADETIFWLARHPDGLFAGLSCESPPSEIDKAQKKQVEFAAKILGELRAMKDRVPIARLIIEALDRTAYDAVLLAEFLGERKLANLYKLIEQARSFDQSGMFTLSDFIAQLAEFIARQPKEPLAATQSETMDVVRLMTIHQAKGLEFPVVIVPDMSWSQRGPDSRAFTPELGPMVKDDKSTVGYHLFSLVEKEEARAETIRLLYVAATRAADYLILSSGLDKPGEIKGPWMGLLSQSFDLSTGMPLEADPPDPQVRVTISRPPLKSEPTETTGRQSLKKLLEKAEKKAEKGEGRLPKYLPPVLPDLTARRQFSFSRLSGALRDLSQFSPGENGTVTIISRMADVDDFPEPVLDPLGLGTLVHAALEEIDFTNPGDFAAIIHRHAQLHLAQDDVDLDEPIDMIGRFLSSLRAAQIAAAKEVHRELEFLLAWHPDNPQSGGRYLQGFIDCLYRDPTGQWRMIDYKTNNITAKTLEQEAIKYEMQMLVYALAAEKILKQPPVELALCFLRPGLEYHFDWNDNARKRIVEMVDRCLP
ncbi:MAG: UvrD-helicase domain-containing protein [Thermoguttaceae bacterium]|jgi:ATP-dependent helicase/nuclease subunit A